MAAKTMIDYFKVLFNISYYLSLLFRGGGRGGGGGSVHFSKSSNYVNFIPGSSVI